MRSPPWPFVVLPLQLLPPPVSTACCDDEDDDDVGPFNIAEVLPEFCPDDDVAEDCGCWEDDWLAGNGAGGRDTKLTRTCGEL